MIKQTKMFLGEKPIGLWFGMPAIRKVTQMQASHDLIEEGVYNSLGVAVVVHASYLNYCVVKEEPVTIPFAEFVDHFETAYLTKDDESAEASAAWNAGVEIVKLFSESFVVQSLVEKAKKKGLQPEIQQVPTPTPTTPIPNDSETPNTGTGSNNSVTDNSD